MRRGPVAWGAAAVVFAVALGVGVGWAFRDAEPPQVWLEVPEGPHAAGTPIEVYVSADVPVRFTLRYGDMVIDEVAAELRASLLALAGRQGLQVDAEAASGLTSTVAREVVALRPPAVAFEAPDVLEVGDAFAVRVGAITSDPWAAALVSASLTLDGARLRLHTATDGRWALASVPLEAPPGTRLLELRLVDALGGVQVLERALVVRANPQPVELLQLSPSVLAVVTPEGRELEADALAAAFATVPAQPRWSDPFLLPLEGRDTSGFGAPRRYGVGGNVSYHQGADLAAPTGTPILATNHGVVRVAGFYPIKGGLVVLDHGQGVTSLYFHQSAIDVAVGDVVVRGDVIGRVGSTGLSTGPHLHWEMRVDGVPSDPMRWVGERYPLAARP
jgi:murein DD-endopeptidase MepM/ murein hydrolase activator NlpD